MAATIRIAVLADASKAIGELKSVGKAASSVHKPVSGLSKILKSGFILGAVAGGVKLLFDAFAGAEDSVKQTKLLDNQIKNLGTSGKAAFADASGFATTFGNSIGVDDDAIKGVMTKLASFPDAFKTGSLGAEGMQRSVKAAYDLQAIGIGTAETNILQIGKAMNSPIKGMAALAKSGVSFSAEQKLQITNYMKHGELAKAQSILLQGIESNAKGAALAAVTPLQQLKVTLSNVAEGLAGKILPGLNSMATAFSTQILPVVLKVADAIAPVFRIIIGGVKAMFASFKSGEGSASGLLGIFQKIGIFGRGVFDKIVAGVHALIASFTSGTAGGSGFVGFMSRLGVIVAAVTAVVIQLAPTVGSILVTAFHALQTVLASVFTVFNSVFNFITSHTTTFGALAVAVLAMAAAFGIYQGVVLIAGVVTKAFAAVQTVLNVVLAANPIGLVVLAIVGLVAAFVFAYKNSETFRNIVIGTWNAIKATAITVFNFLQPFLVGIFDGIKIYIGVWVAAIKVIWDGLQILWTVAKVIFDGIKIYVGVVFDAIKLYISVWVTAVKVVWDGIKILVTVAKTVFDAVKVAITVVLDAVKIYIGLWITAAKVLWDGIKLLATVAKTVFDGIKTTITTILDAVKGAIGTAVTVAKTVWGGIQTLLTLAQTVWGGIKTAVTGALGIVSTTISGCVSAAKTVWAGLTWLVTEAITVMGDIKTAISGAITTIKGYFTTAISGIKTIWTGFAAIFSGVKQAVLGAFSGAASWLISAGRDIIAGLISGIKAMASQAASAAAKVVTDAINAAKNVLHIGSPSKVFADMGKQSILGLVQGLNDGRPLVGRAMAGVAGVMTDTDLSVSGSARNSGTTIILNVSVPPTAQPAETGRVINGYLQEYVTAYGRPIAGAA
jgi:hypothetical protein